MGIARTVSKARYEMIYVAIKLLRRIGIAGEHSGDFIHLVVDPKKNARRYLDLLKGVEDTQESSWSLRNQNITQEEMKRFMVLHYQ